MKTSKKVLSIILAIMMIISIVPLTASAAKSGTCGDNLTWTYDDTTYTLTISGTGAMDDYNPDNRPWESYEDNIKTVVINNGVTTIGNDVFYSCNSLANITIGDSVTTIGDYAFYDCTSLESVTIPDCVTTIGKSAFVNCTSLTSITLPSCLTNIGRLAFSGCTGLTSIILPDSLISIGSQAFFYCTSITSVTLGGVRTIGDEAFGVCESLTSVTIPNSVTTIGKSAFVNCTSLTGIIVDKNNEYYSSNEYGVLFNKDKTTLIQYPAGKIRTSYTIPDSVTKIGDYAFEYCDSLTSVTIPDSVTTIGDYAFYDCTSLTNVTIGDSVTTIGDGAFLNCHSLTSVIIPDSVTTIGRSAFSYCSSLTNVTIPESVTSIGKCAFLSCDSLTSITISDSVITIDESAFGGCSSLTDLTIGDSVTSIGSGAFSSCESLTSITIPDSVTTIGDKAFACCTTLTSVTIPDSVTTIGSGAFDYCESLTSVTIPDSVTTIGYGAFRNCISLTSITIPESVTTIGYFVFQNCTSLTSITIPDSVTAIGCEAFYGCNNLTDVYYGGTETQWNAISIDSSYDGNAPLLNATIHFTDSCYEHIWSEWKVTEAPTYRDEGKEERVCTICGYVETRQVPALKYDTTGDANGDGAVTAVDARLIIQYISGVKDLSDGELEYADANGDGIVTILDAYAIMCCVLGYTNDFDTTPAGTPTKAPDIELNASSDVVKQGDTITIAVTLVENPGIGCMVAELSYDTSAFKVNSAKANYLSAPNYSSLSVTDGKIVYAGANPNDSHDTGVLFTVELVALQTVDSEIAFNVIEAYDMDYDKINIGSEKIKISRERDPSFCGDNLTWTFDETTGTLTISGTGDMYDFGSVSAPWNEFEDKIKSVVINEGATSVGAYAFTYCDNLANISLPDSLTKIGTHSFESCYDLKNIEIPYNVTTIGSEAFSWCSNLKNVAISENVSSIGDGAFSYCGRLEEITVDENNEYYASEDGVLFNKNKTVLIQYPSGNEREKYSIPDSVSTVKSYAFSSCKYLKTLEIPHSVTKLEGSALYSCDSLEYIWVDEKNENYSSDDNGVLFNKDKTLLIQYPIGNPRKKYTIPDTVITVGSFAFYDANNLTDVVIADSVVEIEANAFEECDRLAKVVIPDGIKTIGYEAFASCGKVASISVSASVESIDDRAVYNCRSLEKIIVDEKNQNYSSNDDGVLFNKDKSTLIQYPIGNKRKSYTIPDSVSKIENDAFIFSQHLVDVTIHAGVTSIAYDSFAFCYSMEKFVVDENNKYYSNDGFGVLFDKNKTTLIQYPIGNTRTEYKIPESVTMIHTFAFDSCDYLTTLYISKNLNLVRSFAICSMYNLTDVYYSGTEEEWKQICIDRTNHSLLNANIHFEHCEHPDVDNDGYCDNCDIQLCDHNCHKGGISGFFWKIANFFNKLFRTKQYCECGVAHY